MGATAKTNKKSAKDSAAEAIIDPATQLHEIQKLLFGHQIEQLENAIAELKSDTSKHLSQIEKQLGDTLDKQRKDFQGQLALVSQKLDETSEQHARREALIEDEIDGLRKSLEGFEAQTEAAQDALDKQIRTESQHLTEELNEKYAFLLEQLKSSTDHLNDQKLDRSVLADLLTTMAEKIQLKA